VLALLPVLDALLLLSVLAVRSSLCLGGAFQSSLSRSVFNRPLC